MRKILLSSLAATALLCGQLSTGYSQFITASTLDQNIVSPGAAKDVKKTNTAAVEIPLGGTSLQVMTFDGSTPGFGWDYGGITGNAPLLGNSIGTVAYPDIVADPSASPGDERVLIIYHVNNQSAYFEVHEWSGTAFVPIVGPTLISTVGTSVSYPSVDIFSTGQAVMSWTESGKIKGRGYILPSLQLSPNTFTASSCAGSPNNDRSDVAIFNPTAGGDRVNFAFVSKNGAIERLRVQRATYAQVWAGSPATCSPGWINTLDMVNTNIQKFGPARIACPNRFFTSLSVLDLSVAIEKHTFSSNKREIFNYTHRLLTYGANVFTTTSLNTSPFDISSCDNRNPAISYVGRFIIVTWTEDDCTNSVSNEYNVIARQMFVTGIPWAPFNTYSIINQGIVGHQQASAVDGKFSRAYNGFYSWSNDTQGYVQYKSSYYYNQSLREETEVPLPVNEAVASIEFNAFPNPMIDNATFSFNLLEGEQGEHLEIYDLSGRVVERLSILGSTTGNNQVVWQTADLPAGVYLVRLLTDQRTESIRITKP